MDEQPALVVGFDRHSASHIALKFAVGLAAKLGAHVHVAHILDMEDTPVDADVDSESWSRHVDQQLELEHEDARRIIAESGCDWTYHSRTGDPADQLSAIAEEHDALLILVGSPHPGLRSVLDHLLGGAVAKQLLRRSARPVVLVPDTR